MATSPLPATQTIPETAGKPQQTRVYYPVGTFTTVLAGPDIAEAKRLGCLKAVGRGQVHQLGYPMAEWAAWSLRTQDDPDTPAAVRMALKHHGRAVAGKCAGHAWSKAVIGLSTTYGWHYEEIWDAETSSRAAVIDMAGTKFLTRPDGNAPDAYPAVLAWIEAYTRVALSRAIEYLGDRAVVQCDTDGLIASINQLNDPDTRQQTSPCPGMVDRDRVNRVLQSLNQQIKPLVMREKTVYRTIEVRGPQHMTLDGRKHWSGIPASATLQQDGSYKAWQWPKLAWQLSQGDQRGYTRVTQVYRLAASYAPGWLIDDGRVMPVETTIDTDGHVRLMRYSESRYAQRGLQLTAHQATALEPYR